MTSNHYCSQGTWYSIDPYGNTYVNYHHDGIVDAAFPDSVKTYNDICGIIVME